MSNVVPFDAQASYARIVNPMLEAFARGRLTQHQYQVVFAVLRKTYGWNKEWDYISGEQLADLTGLKRQNCSKAVNQLIANNVILRKGGSRSPMKINPDFNAWERSEKGSKNNRVNHYSYERFTEPYYRSFSEPLNGAHNRKNYIYIYNYVIDCSELHSEPTPKSPKKITCPHCPHKELLVLWEEVIPETTQHNPSSWTSERSGYKNLAKRWKAGFVTEKRNGEGVLYTDKETGLAWWKRLFVYLRKSSFLIHDCRPFCLEWAVKPANYNKILEGNYHD